MIDLRRLGGGFHQLLAPVLVAALLAAACSSSATVATERDFATAVPTVAVTEPLFMPTSVPEVAPPQNVEVSTPVPSATLAPTPAPTPQPEGPCEAGPLALPNPDRPRYEAVLVIEPASGTITGTLAIDFTPDLDIDEVYLRLWPNGPRPASGGVAMELRDLRLGSEPIVAEMVTPTVARIALDEPVPAGQRFSIDMGFDVVIPAELTSRISGRDDYMRLGTILPILPWEPGRGWALEPATGLFAEAVSSPVADYAVDVRVSDGYDVLASGVVDDTGTWRVEAARDFALSVGRFRMVTGVALAPEPVQITVGVHETIDDDAGVYLAKIIDSLEQFSSRWGQYPWPSLTFAITPNLPGGIEFPTHVMQGPDTIGRTTSHEVGHMFFYSLVGNNQGAAPWLDEGIASYAEFTYEGVGAGAYEIPAAGIGNATQPMTFWENNSDIYYRSVYGQTGFALLRLGSQVEVDCALARYMAENAHQIATAQDFVEAFEPTFPNVVEDLAAMGVVIGN